MESMSRLNVLVADPDQGMAGILRSVLREFGIYHVDIVRTSDEAAQVLHHVDYDMMITDWMPDTGDGLNLIRYVRKSRHSPSPMLPVLIATAKDRKPHVEAARDAGINEYLLKPYSAKSIFERLSMLVEQPRCFVSTSEYVGPDRRRRAEDPGSGNRREKELPVIPFERLHGAPLAGKNIMVAPNRRIRRKLRLTAPLSNYITPSVVEKAQKTIEDCKDVSLIWLREDLEVLEGAFRSLWQHPQDQLACNLLQWAALDIKSHAGTFGFGHVMQTAQLLYCYLDGHSGVLKPMHLQILEQYVKGLKILVAYQASGHMPNDVTILIQELGALNRIAA